MKGKNLILFFGVLLITVVAANWVLDGFREDNVDNSWRPSAYNRQVTNCLEQYGKVARVYDFDKMSDRTNEQLSEITGVDKGIIAKCRR
jgi:hypothetical protein